jgi:indole-3-acetate monooxygenase
MDMTAQDVLAAIERVRPVIEQYRDEAEQNRRLSDAVIEAIQKEGLFKIWTPKEYGGAEVDLPTFMTAVEAMATIDCAAGWTFCNMATGGTTASRTPAAGAREIFSGDVLGAGAVAPKGRAVPVDGGYWVSGRWPLTSGIYHADWIGANCLVFEGQAPRMGPHGAPDFTIMFIPREDCTIIDTWYSTGMRGTGSADFAVEDVFVPERRAFSLFGSQSHVSNPVFQLGPLASFLTALTNVSLGIARTAIDEFVTLANSKVPTLSQTRLADRPTVHAEVARAEALYQSARAYLHEVAREMMASVNAGQGLPPQIEARRRLACVTAAESSEKAVDMMYRLGGQSSLYTGSRLERCLRDIHAVNQHTLASPVWWEKTGQSYFGQGLGMP